MPETGFDCGIDHRLPRCGCLGRVLPGCGSPSGLETGPGSGVGDWPASRTHVVC